MTREPIVIIDTYDVPARDQKAFLDAWQGAHDFLMTQAGYRSSRLHRSLGTGAHARFVNVTEWDSDRAYLAAMASLDFGGITRADPFAAPLYQVVRADERWDGDRASARSDRSLELAG